MSFGFVYVVLVGKAWDWWHCQPAFPLVSFYQSGKWKSEASLKSRKAAAMRGGGLYPPLSLQTSGRNDCIVSATPKSQEGSSDQWLALQGGGSCALEHPLPPPKLRHLFCSPEEWREDLFNTEHKVLSKCHLCKAPASPIRIKIHSVLIFLDTSHAKMQS